MCHCLGTTVIIIAFLFSALSLQSFAETCTNDIDRLFDGICSTNILGLGSRLHGACEAMNPMSKERSIALKRYAFGRLLSISVSTNTFGFSYVLNEKARLVENSERILVMEFGEEDVRSILASCALLSTISTNNLSLLREEAKRNDQVLYGSRTVGASWNHRKNMSEWRQYKSLVVKWNAAVEKYRECILAYSHRLLDRIWANVPEQERLTRIRSIH